MGCSICLQVPPAVQCPLQLLQFLAEDAGSRSTAGEANISSNSWETQNGQIEQGSDYRTGCLGPQQNSALATGQSKRKVSLWGDFALLEYCIFFTEPDPFFNLRFPSVSLHVCFCHRLLSLEDILVIQLFSSDGQKCMVCPKL